VNPQTVTVSRYRLDKYGDRHLIAKFIVGECMFAPRDTTEVDNRSTAVNADADLYAPPWIGVEPQDVVKLADGTEWEVTGLPARWDSPYPGSWNAGVLVHLNRARG